MLNPFPEVLSYGLIAPVLLRLCAGLFFIIFGIQKLRGGKEGSILFFEALGLRPAKIYTLVLGGVQIITGALLVLGLATQVAGIITAIIALVSYIVKMCRPEMGLRPANIYLLLFVICASLVLSGAGFLAFDLPL